jgi:hypothetical protein
VVSTVQQVLMGLILVGLATSLTLPDRKTDVVIKAAGSVFNGGLKTAMTGK